MGGKFVSGPNHNGLKKYCLSSLMLFFLAACKTDPGPAEETPAKPRIQISDLQLAEGNSGLIEANLSVLLSTAHEKAVSIDYATEDGQATSPDDYKSINGTFIFSSGETRKTLSVEIVTDTVPEVNEQFTVNFYNPKNAVVETTRVKILIVNDDIDAPELLLNPGPQIYSEEQSYTLSITARPSARIFVNGLPPGMIWNEAERRFDFRPDFIQGGKSWQVTMDAIDGTEKASETFLVTVENTIQPPWPQVVAEENLYQITKLEVVQTTDDFLDSPGNAGRTYTANLVIPDSASGENFLPVRIGLHGSGGSPGTVGGANYFGVAPHDSIDTWWTGYSDQLPNGTITQGKITNYTQRRVMHLFSYLVEHYPGVDLERVEVSGQSMGGTGSYFLALRYARHFSFIFSRIGGTTSYYLTNWQKDSLAKKHWGLAELGLPTDSNMMSVWQYFDASRGLLSDHDLRNLYFSTAVGQNDKTISFDHMVAPSPVTGKSFLGTLQTEAIGHFIIWDQRAHSVSEGPPLNGNWWEPLDDASALARNRAFPAFTNSSADDDPGLQNGQGGYTGTLRGAINRYPRWDEMNIVDTRERLSVRIKVDIDTGGIPPDPNYPPINNHYYGATPITADVTIRRIQNFQLLPGETVNWSYNSASGVVFANDDGSVTVPDLEILPSYTALILVRK